MPLKRKTRDFNLTVKEISDEGEFSGYGSVFDTIDFYGEVIAPGAFSKSLETWAEKGKLPPVLWQHDSHQPVGPFTKMVEDAKGLYVEGRLLIKDVPKAREAHALLKAGAISGMSVGFDPIAEEFNKDTKLITHTESDLWEVSIVTFPANKDAGVELVRSIMDGLKSSAKLPTLREFEGFLREAGFSKSQATAIASRGLGPLLRDADSGIVEPVDVRSMVAELFPGASVSPFSAQELIP